METAREKIGQNGPGASRILPQVALIGRPNVGKSTLFNRLTGSKAALVDNTPGLTRDRRYGTAMRAPCPFTLIDTGGLGTGLSDTDQIGQQVIEQTLRALDEADLLVIIFDAREGLTPEDQDVLELLRRARKPFLAVVNKVEGKRADVAVAEFYETGIEELLPISARTGKGIAGLLERICEELESNKIPVLDGAEIQASGQGAGPKSKGPESSGAEEPRDRPIRVCIIGRPNVGKSSLLNRIIGEQRMIVADVPGTTRDSIDTLLSREKGHDLILVDTAGIRRKSKVRDKIEKFSVLKAIEAIKSSDIAVVVMDATEGITDQDKRLIGYTAQYGKGCITLYNKWDLVRDDPGLRRRLNREAEILRKVVPYAPHLNISALSGSNVQKLLPLIDQVFADFSFRQSTGRLNRLLKEALLRRNPPVVKGHFLKIYYMTQTDVRPPCFVLFCNYPDLFPEHYRRFLANFFRRQCGIPHTPIRIVFRQSH
jgi:GTP-binding protein